MEETQRDYLSMHEAAIMLGIKRQTLLKWTKIRKHIDHKDFRCPPYYRIGSRYRFKKEDIEKFINESRTE